MNEPTKMTTLRLTIELEYDADMMHSPTKEGWDWFVNDILQNAHPKEGLVLHSNSIGDEVGIVKVLSIDSPPEKPCDTLDCPDNGLTDDIIRDLNENVPLDLWTELPEKPCDKPDCPDNDLCFEMACMYRHPEQEEKKPHPRHLTRGLKKGAI